MAVGSVYCLVGPVVAGSTAEFDYGDSNQVDVSGRSGVAGNPPRGGSGVKNRGFVGDNFSGSFASTLESSVDFGEFFGNFDLGSGI